MNFIHKYFLLLVCFAGGLILSACSSDEFAAEGNGQTEERQLVIHELSVALDGVSSRVAYTPADDGLQLSWDANETLGVYILKTDGTYIYAGTVSGNGAAGDRGPRRFSGSVSEKSDGEKYVYIHPALTDDTTPGNTAAGKVVFTSQTGKLGNTDHLKKYIPLVWNESSSLVSNHGYAVRLKLKFKEDPGKINKVTLQTMDEVGVTNIFPESFNISTMKASATNTSSVSLTISGGETTKHSDGTWMADVYLVSSHCDVNVFRTKFNVKIEAENGTFYNEFFSFPGQENANAIEGQKMLANGQCYNLETSVSKDVATTIVSSNYKVNSLLGMWNTYGKSTDPFGLIRTAGLPLQLKDNILDKKETIMNRMLENKSSQGTPTFTWDMVTKQCNSSYKQDNVTYNNIDIVGEPTEVFVTFISEYAWSQNLLGYYHYETGSVPSSSNDVLKTIIFPNVSKGGHVPYNKGGVDGGANINPNTEASNIGEALDAPLSEYTTVQLLYNAPDGTVSKFFPIGTTIGFFMMRDPKASSSGHDEGTLGDTTDDTHSGYQPRPDNTLLDWTSWRLFTNTAWNRDSGNTNWWDMNCHNFFCSADVGDSSNGGVIPGLALYGAKDDASHNYNYSFSAMLYMVSTSNPASMKTYNKAYFNLGSGIQVVGK